MAGWLLVLPAVLVLLALLQRRPWERREDVSGKDGLPQKMRAVVYSRHGTPNEVLEVTDSHPLPQLAPDEVLIHVHAAAINPVDWKIVGGSIAFIEPLVGMRMPMIPGFDVAGIVVRVGNACKRFRPGDHVFCMADFRKRGSLAEYVAVIEHRVARKPRNTTWDQAASLPLVSLTSYQALVTIGRVQPGQHVVVLGGSGGTGAIGVQLARHLGAYVTATASARNIESVRSLGAHNVIDYTSHDWAHTVCSLPPSSASHCPVDVIYDTVGGPNWQQAAAQGSALLRPGSGHFISIVGDDAGSGDRFAGGLLSYLRKGWAIASRRVQSWLGKGPRYTLFTCFGDGDSLERIGRIVEEGAIRPHVDKVYVLARNAGISSSDARERVVEGFEYQKSGRARGKVVFRMYNWDAPK